MMPQTVEKFPTRSQFSAEINSIFSAGAASENSIDLTLVRLDEFVINDIQENFSLLFRTRPDLQAEQGIFDLVHDRLGRFSVFLVPVMKDKEGLYFEAVFNNLKK